MLKKEEERKEKKSMPWSMNNPMLRSMKKRKRKKDSPYFQIKYIHPKERFMIQRSTKKYLELGLYEKFHTLAPLDQSV